MARPKKNNADYFSHDADMRNDLKIKALRRKYGHVGYSIWNMFLEVLTDTDHFEVEWTDLNIEIMSGDFDCEPKFLREVIEYCSDTLKLFVIENGKIYSIRHRERFENLLSKRKRDRKRVIAIENPHSIVEYSKVKESKEEKSKGNRVYDIGFETTNDIKKYFLKEFQIAYNDMVFKYGKSVVDKHFEAFADFHNNHNWKDKNDLLKHVKSYIINKILNGNTQKNYAGKAGVKQAPIGKKATGF